MKQERYLIALDLDGTLLTDNKKISPFNKKIIQQLMEEGHIVVIATGRPHRASIMYYHELGLNTPMVNFNGALIHHPTDDRWDAVHSPLPNRIAKEIIHTCYQLEVKNILAEIKDDMYLDVYDERIVSFFTNPEETEKVTIGSLKNHLKGDPTSIMIQPKEGQLDHIRDYLDQHHASIIEHRQWGVPYDVIEIVKKGVNKATGLQKVAHYFQIPSSNIIAFGDEDNDMEMIQFAGFGIAMGNAIEPLKSVATDVTTSNQEDGVGRYLQQMFQLT